MVIAEQANPESTSVPLIGWSHWRALQSLTSSHLVTHIRNREALLRAGLAPGDFTAIDSERVARFVWRLSNLIRGGRGKGWTTAMSLYAIAYLYFERLVWRHFRESLASRQFDLVHRLTPLSPTIPSLLAKKCASAGVPMVLGPLNGGLPWPRGFGHVRRQEREWLGYVRDAYKLFPGYRSTRKYAAAIIVGSRATQQQISSEYRQKCVYIPENGIDPARFRTAAGKPDAPPVRVAFVGRLVPYKGADILIEAAAPLVRQGAVQVELIGDGPQKPALVELARREKILSGIRFTGALPHPEVARRLASMHVLGFPSIREFGGAVVLESMALGVVPMVVDYGGPGELVTDSTGFRVPIGSRPELVHRFRELLTQVVQDPGRLEPIREKARRYVLQEFTWEAKARKVLEVYEWALEKRSRKPDFAAICRERP